MSIVLTQSLPAADLKIQFMEPYVSRGLNQKTEGVVPTGIYRGYTPSVLALQLTLATDVLSGDSVAVASSVNGSLAGNNYNATVNHVGDIVLDLTGVANGVYSVVLEAQYDFVSPTPLTGLTVVRIKLVDGGDLLTQHVILTRVTRAGILLTLDNSTREDNGGALVTQSQLTGGVLGAKPRFLGYADDDSSGSTGAGDIASPVVNFALTAVQDLLVVASGGTVGDAAFQFIGLQARVTYTGGGGGTVLKMLSSVGLGAVTTAFLPLSGSRKFPAIPAGNVTVITNVASLGPGGVGMRREAAVPLILTVYGI